MYTVPSSIPQYLIFTLISHSFHTHFTPICYCTKSQTYFIAQTNKGCDLYPYTPAKLQLSRGNAYWAYQLPWMGEKELYLHEVQMEYVQHLEHGVP